MGNLIHNNINDYDLFLECVDYSTEFEKTPDEISDMTIEEMVHYLGWDSIAAYVADKAETDREDMIERVMNLPLSGNECGMILREMRLI